MQLDLETQLFKNETKSEPRRRSLDVKWKTEAFDANCAALLQPRIRKICRSQVCKALCSLFCSLTCDDASVFPFQNIPPGDIYTPDYSPPPPLPPPLFKWPLGGRGTVPDKR